MAKKRKYSSKNFNEMIKILKNPQKQKKINIKILEQPSFLELNSYFFVNKKIIFSQKENVADIKKKKMEFKKILKDLNFEIVFKNDKKNRTEKFSEIFLRRNSNSIFHFLQKINKCVN